MMQRLDDTGDINAPPGSREWCAAMRLHVQGSINDARSRVSHLKFDLKSIRDHAYFATLDDREGNKFATWEDFCQYPRPWGLGFSAAVANAIIEEKNGDKLISAVAAETMANAKPLAEHGGDRREQGSDRTLVRGETASYLAARIKRDRPDIAEAVERGEYRSIRQAAIAAGIVKQKTPLDLLLSAWAKASKDERDDFMRRVAA